jgi:hypothetical protein
MNEFLYSKFLNFTVEGVEAFSQSIVDNMPSKTTGHLIDGDSRTWGFDGQNFWYCKPTEARYYHTDGTIDIISSTKDQSYFDNCNILYNISKSENKTLMGQPVSISTYKMPTVPNHTIPSGAILNLLQFKANSYGITSKMVYLLGLGEDDFVSYIQSMTDAVTWVLQSMHDLGYSKFPNLFECRDKVMTDSGIVFLVFPESTLSKADCLTAHINYLESVISNQTTVTQSAELQELNTIISIARNTWTNLLSN